MKPSDFPPPTPDLLNLIAKYLTSHGFTNTVHTLNKDRKLRSRVGKWEDNKQMRKGDLGKIFREWEGRQGPGAKANNKDKVKQKEKQEAQKTQKIENKLQSSSSPTSSSSSSSASSSSSSDSDADDESECSDHKSVSEKFPPKMLKRKAPSSRGSRSSPSSSLEDGHHKFKKAKIIEATKKTSSSSGSDSSSDSDSSSNSESDSSSDSSSSGPSDSSQSSSSSESGDSACALSLPSSGDSDSNSNSSANSSSEPEFADSSKENKAPTQKHISSQDPGKASGGLKISSDSSATLEGDNSSISGPKNEKPSIKPANTIANRKHSLSHSSTPSTTTSGSTPSSKKVKATTPKSQNRPFSRIGPDVKVDPRLASNAYVPYDYAERAHRDLSVTKGKGFTKEKNKKKRGSYRGGQIDTEGVKSFKFED